METNLQGFSLSDCRRCSARMWLLNTDICGR